MIALHSDQTPVVHPASRRAFSARLVIIAMVALIAIGTTSACTVSESYTVRYYPLDEGQRVKRIVQATLGSPEISQTPTSLLQAAVFAMFQGVVREFVSHHHEYILLGGEVLPADSFDDLPAEDRALPGRTASIGGANPGAAIQKICQSDYDGKRAHGVLLSQFQQLAATDDAVLMQVEARLIDCETGLLVWRALGANTYTSNDPDLEQTIRGYSNRYGEQVKPYVAGSFLLARKLFESMPDPTLTEDDIIEKIEIDALAD